MKIFLASLRTWAPTFVYLISENNKVDFFGCWSEFSYNKNVEYFGSYYKCEIKVIEFLKEYWKIYDFIIMPDFDWQLNYDFQILKKIIKIPILTPSIEANQIERDKIFSKKLLNFLDIPQPNYQIFKSIEQIENYGKEKFVFKLANSYIHSGFQTRIFSDESYKKIVPLYFSNGFMGDAYIEDFISGKEAVLHFLCNGVDNLYLGASRDYKKIYDGDKGINISSAGSYSTVDYISTSIIDSVQHYVKRIQGIIDYVGIMSVGIIISENSPYVLEINVRPGVPEFNTLILTLNSNDLLTNFYKAASRSNFNSIKNLDNRSVTIQIFNKNYSWHDKEVTKIPDRIYGDELYVTYFEKEFHQNNYYCSISATGKSTKDAANKVYENLGNKNLGDYTFRKDIGFLE